MMLEQLPIKPVTGFDVNNLPFGIFSTPDNKNPRPGVAIGNSILDLAELEAEKLIGYGDHPLFNCTVLNTFAEAGPLARHDIRLQLQALLTSSASKLLQPAIQAKAIVNRETATMHYPFLTRGYTDFYSSENHARNVGSLFRDPENALNPNWKHLPVAYHGRTSTLTSDHVSFKRPKGQILNPETKLPVYSECKKMDYEIEMGMFIAQGNQIFEPIMIGAAKDALFGLAIVNDWSARDIQAWEYVPLGPFLGKNFLTSVSPWVVTPEALAPFKKPMPEQDPQPCEYLHQETRNTYDIILEAKLKTASGHEEVISKTNFSFQYWSIEQQIAHHSVNGCKLDSGDLLASGTLSGPKPAQCGSLLEISKNGKEPLQLKNGEQRSFLENGDTLTITAYAVNQHTSISFGSISGTLVE